ncbi:hypothetical protein SO802_031721 [Lithocarpus litseifolius]|uniref:NAC domain-containing protein n=1 Tax=Lithocarpus litseifolius TaxID=425828 RepID=A0AAW2BPH4_9ROSI
MEEAIVVNKGEELIDLPPGFRFHPTDEEIITYYLTEKVVNSNFSASAIGEADLNKCEPWDLPKKAKMGEKEWYFFCQRDRKYPTGMRTNRATESGYWKATGKDKEIYKGKGCLVGMKKTLVFYKGRAPKGEKTNWVMHEYRLEGKFSYYNLPKTAKDEWVVCRIFHKNNSGIKKSSTPDGLLRINSFGDDLLDISSLPPLMDPPFSDTNKPGYVDNNNFPFKGSSSYFSNDHQQQQQQQQQQLKQQDQKMFQMPTNASYHNPIPNQGLYPQTQVPNQYPFNFPANPIQSGYLHQGRSTGTSSSIPSSNYGFGVNEQGVLERQCKVEQFSSNQSMSMVSHSQDTGLSTADINAEISSLVSKQQDNRSYDDLIEGPSLGPIADFDRFNWDY